MDFQNIPQQTENATTQSQDSENKTTLLRTCFNGLNALSGVGVLSISYALSQGGWLSLILLFMVAGICYYTAILLQMCMNSDSRIKTYPDIGKSAFGKKGRYAISVFIYLELYLVLVEMLILEGDNLHMLFPGFNMQIGEIKLSGKQVFTVLSALIILPMTWCRSFGLLAYVSLGGVLVSFVLLISVFWVGAFDGVGFHEKGALWKWSGLPTAISLYTFCYGGHSVFPSLSDSMKVRSQFSKVLQFCFGASTLAYGLMAILAYMMYGESVLSQVTLNLPPDKISSKIAICTTLLSPLTKYPIYIFPIAAAIEKAFHLHKNMVLSILIRTSLVFGTLVLALSIPFFGEVMSFIGAFLIVSISVLFPCLCYLKITKAYRRINMELASIVLIMILGISVLVSGTYVSLANIVEHFKAR